MSKSPGKLPLPLGEGRGEGLSAATPQGNRGAVRSPGDDPIAAEIQAEIADHLATAAEKLQSQGLASDQAREKSQAKFGDPAIIGRRCYWIKQGDALMLRTATIVVLTLFCVALGVIAFTSYSSQRQMAEQMAALAAQLKLLADQQKVVAKSPPPAAEPKPLEITGKVFIGAPEKPSVNTEVMICRVSDGEIVRRVSTKSDGTFDSGPLTEGDYAVVADGVKDNSWKGSIAIQTAPIYLYPTSPSANVAVDAAYRGGRIAVKLSRPLPKLKVEGKYVIDSRLYLRVSPSLSSLRTVRWTVAEPAPDHWPVYIRDAERPPSTANSPNSRPRDTSGSAVLSNAKLEEDPLVDFRSTLNPLPAGPCVLRASIVADVVPDGPLELDSMIFNNRSGYRYTETERQWMSDQWAVNETLGQVWFFTLVKRLKPNTAYTSLSSLNHVFLQNNVSGAEVTIADGCVTSLLVDVPDDVESRIQSLVETVTDPDEFKDAVLKDNPFIRHAKITVLGSEPLHPQDASASQ